MATRDPVGGRSWFGGPGVAVTTVALGYAAGPWGVAAGIATAVAWYRLTDVYAFAVGQLLAVATLSGAAPIWPVAAAELGLLGVLVGSVAGVDRPGRPLAVFGLATLLFWAIAWGLIRTGRPLWSAAGLVAVVAATAAYGLHRYELVELGLLEEAT